MKKLLIGTTNPGKWNEMASILSNLPVQLLTPTDLNILDDVEESGTTYQQNALIKAKHYHAKSGLPTLGEDSGIVVDALAGELGVFTRRWGAGPQASDSEWLDFFMNRMQDFPNPEQRKARFISHMTLIIDGKEEHFYGETEGVITPQIEAELYAGVPLSSVFKPLGYEIVYSAMTDELKNQISHRGKAIKQVHDHLKSSYGL